MTDENVAAAHGGTGTGWPSGRPRCWHTRRGGIRNWHSSPAFSCGLQVVRSTCTMVKGFTPDSMMVCVEAFCSHLRKTAAPPMDKSDLRDEYAQYRLKTKKDLRLPSFGGIMHFLVHPHTAHGSSDSARCFICMACSRAFSNAYAHQQHLSSSEHKDHALAACGQDAKEDTASKARACPFRGCDEVFDNMSQLRSHADSAPHFMLFVRMPGQVKGHRHRPCSGYACLMCGDPFELKAELTTHWSDCPNREAFCSTNKTWRQDSVDVRFEAVPPLSLDVDEAGTVNATVEKSSKSGRVTCTLRNTTRGAVNLKRCTLLSKWQKLLVTTTGGTRINGNFNVTLGPGIPFVLYLVPCELDSYGYHKGHLHLEFLLESTGRFFTIDIPVNLRIVSADFFLLGPSTSYVPTKTMAPSSGPILDGTPPSARRIHPKALGILIDLKSYPVPQDMKARDTRQPRMDKALLPLNASTYVDKFSNLLFLEELQMERDIRFYTMPRATMEKQGNYFYLEVPGVVEKRPSVLKGDSLLVTMLTSDGQPDTSKRYRGYVYEIQQTKLKLSFHESLASSHISGTKYMVEFSFNRFPLTFSHRAVEMADANKLWSVVFPSYSRTSWAAGANSAAEGIRFKNRLIEGNEEQQKAVRRIVSEASGSVPYVIFGPPGTGKTIMMVEAMTQVFFCDKSSRILACTPYNEAADLLAHLLLEHIPKSALIRVNCQWRLKKDIAYPEVAEVANYDDDGEVWYPPLEVFASKRVVVCTLIAAGRLASADLGREFFSHIFIDECGHAIEPESIIPIASFVRLDGSDTPTHLVLAGDPRQLSPMLRSKEAVQGGLALSLLERLILGNSVYARSGSPKKYNDSVLTKLIKNYRSHQAILNVPNEMFYDGELVACADLVERSKFCKWSALPKENFPVIVHGVSGKAEREGESPSFFNVDEAVTACDYVVELLGLKSPKVKPEHVGIIAPYRKQIQKIRLLLQDREKKSPVSLGVNNVKIGTVEEFQGQERSIIIVSTVCSIQKEFVLMDAKHNLGFLKNPKRFNVSITRAKSLLIVIGNPLLLLKDDCWKRFITYCHKNGGVTPSHMFDCLIGDNSHERDSDEEESGDQSSLTDDLDHDAENGASLLQTILEPEWRSQL